MTKCELRNIFSEEDIKFVEAGISVLSLSVRTMSILKYSGSLGGRTIKLHKIEI